MIATPPPAWRTDGGDWPNRAHSRFVSAGGVRWHVQVTGSAGGAGRVAGERVAGAQVAGERVAGAQVAGERVAGAQVAGERVAGAQVAGTQVAGESVAGAQVAGTQVAGESVAAAQVAGAQAAEERVAGERVPGTQVVGARVAGAQVVATDAGDKPVLLLLHGTGAATHSWRDMLPALAERWTVVAPDLPGHGFSSALTAPTLPAVAASVAALTAALGLTPALIVGHSAGAAVALRLSLDAPVPVIGFNAALRPFPGIAATLFPALAKLLFVNPFVPGIMALQARGPGVVEGFLKRATGSTIDARGVELYTRLFRRRDHVAGALALMANWDLAALAADWPRVAAPLRLIAAGNDAAIPPAAARAVAAKIAGAAAIDWPGLGHLAHEEDPAGAVRLIDEAAAAWGIG